MGAGGSSSFPHKVYHVGKSTSEVVRLMMPVYFTEDLVSEPDIVLAKSKWFMRIPP